MAYDEEVRTDEYPWNAVALLNNTDYLGRLDNPASSAYLKGPCGDAMTFYLMIDNDKITKIKCFPDGCHATIACGAMTAHLAEGKTVMEALSISAGQVMEKLKGLPKDHLHCSILAVSTLYRAIAEYLLKK